MKRNETGLSSKMNFESMFFFLERGSVEEQNWSIMVKGRIRKKLSKL